MGLESYKISEYANPVSSLPDRPTEAGYSAAQLKAAFDANATGEIKSGINAIIDFLEGLTNNEQFIGIRVAADGQLEISQDGINWSKPTDDGKVDKETGKGLSANDYDNTEKDKVAKNTAARHSHLNKAVLDGITEDSISDWNGKPSADDVLTKTNAEVFTPTGEYQPATKKYVDDKVVSSGAADMTQAVYDPTGKQRDIFAYAIPRLTSAVSGNIAVFGDGGVLTDGGIKFSIVNGGLRVTYDDGL